MIHMILKWAILHDEYFWYFKYILMHWKCSAYKGKKTFVG